MVKEVLEEAQLKMDLAVEHTAQDFSNIRTGRASPGILNRVMVDYYGTQTPLNQLAGFAVPDARMLVVQPYDKTAMDAIERAITEANLGLNPSNDGNIIRLSFPALTEERRKELIRMVRNTAEEGRISVRNVRRQVKDEVESIDDISEDEVRRAEKTLQELTDASVGRIDSLLAHKEDELLEV
jgi:ribosome recycling factor